MVTVQKLTILHAPNHAPDVAGATIRLATRTGADSIGMSEAYRVTRLLAHVDGYRVTYGKGARDRRRGAKDVPILTKTTHASLGAGAVQISEAAKPVRLAPDRWLTFSLFASELGPVAHLNLHPNAGVAHAPATSARRREYAESMATLERYVRLFRLEGFLVVVTGDLNYPANLHEDVPAWAPSEVFRRLDLGVWSKHLDYIAFDQRLKLFGSGVMGRHETGSDHPWLLATFTRRQTKA